MSPKDLELIRDAHGQALRLNPEERERFLEQQFPLNLDLRSEVLQLLQWHDEAGDFLTKPCTETLIELEEGDPHPRRLGPYELIRPLGRGGFATVHLARRADLHEQQVAIKVLNQLSHSEDGFQRFQKEARILAKLAHPNIVNFIDAGTTGGSISYIVTEFVDGQPIDEFARSLSQKERLQLFLKVCDAVSAAHRSLIVHRDIKPSNILVTHEGNPKLLDFGIALLLDQDGRFTETGFDRMTIRYASPEQIRRDKTISTSSDVYSLGVLLYEMILEKSPYRESDDLARQTDEIAHRDPVAPREVDGSIKPDLEAIILRALRKEPIERYRSVDALSEDIRRFLDGRAVDAYQGKFLYQTRKLFWRNRLFLTVAASLALVALVGTAVSYEYARRADQSMVEAARLSAGIVEELSIWNGTRNKKDLFTVARQTQFRITELAKHNPHNVELRRQLLSLMLEMGELQGHPDAHNMGDPDGAMQTFQKAVALGEELSKDDRNFYLNGINLSRAYCAMGTMYLRVNQLDKALENYRRAVEIHRNVASTGKTYTDQLSAEATAMMYVSEIQCREANLAGCIDSRKQVVGIMRNVVRSQQSMGSPAGLSTLAGNLQTLGATLSSAKRYSEALAAFDEALAISSQLLSQQPDSPNLLSQKGRIKYNLGRTNLVMGRAEGSLRYLREALGIFHQVDLQDSTSEMNARDVTACLTWLSLAEKKNGLAVEAVNNEKLALQRAADLANRNPHDAPTVEFAESVRQRLRKGVSF